MQDRASYGPGGMLYTLLSHLGCTQSPIHVGKSMLCVAELPVGVERISSLSAIISMQRGSGFLCGLRATGRFFAVQQGQCFLIFILYCVCFLGIRLDECAVLL